MPRKAPLVYNCPCCGARSVRRMAGCCRWCRVPLYLEGESLTEPCYVYLSQENRWIWLESGVMKPWQDGWKRRPNYHRSARYPWIEQFPGRPTGRPRR